MYKDKVKQRQAAKERQRRYKARQKGVTSEGVTGKALPDGVESHTCPDCGVTITGPGYPKLHTCRKPANFGQPDCQCRHCQNNRATGSHHVLNHGPYKPASELKDNELNRVSLPGDQDYMGDPNAKHLLADRLHSGQTIGVVV